MTLRTEPTLTALSKIRGPIPLVFAGGGALLLGVGLLQPDWFLHGTILILAFVSAFLLRLVLTTDVPYRFVDTTEVAAVMPSLPPDAPGFLDRLPISILRVSIAGGILDANRAAKQLLAAPAGSLINELLTDLRLPVDEWLKTAQDGSGKITSEVVRVKADGPDFFLASLHC